MAEKIKLSPLGFEKALELSMKAGVPEKKKKRKPRKKTSAKKK